MSVKVGWALPALSTRTKELVQQGKWQRAEGRRKKALLDAFLLFQLGFYFSQAAL